MSRRVNTWRQGTVYLIVLATVTLVTVIGIAGVLAVRSERAAAVARIDALQARANAMSALEYGMQVAQNTSAWRTSVPGGGVVLTRGWAGGTIALTVTDPVDSNLTNSLSDSVLLTGEGRYGNAVQSVSVKLVPSMTPIDALSSAVHCGSKVVLGKGNSLRIDCDAPLGTNYALGGAIVATNATVTANVYAVGTITGSNYSGTQTSPAAARHMPVPSTLFATYAAMGTAISYASLPSHRLDKVLLSSGSNPYGPTNAQGIYVIDCGGSTIEILNSRISGTLVLLNVGSGSGTTGPCLIESLNQDSPCLLVQGPFAFSMGTSDLSELTLVKNFNPTGSAYRGQTNLLSLDSYPSLLGGIVYVSGDASVESDLAIEGTMVVGGKLSVVANLTVRHVPIVNGPAGFTTGNGFTASSTTWAKVVN